MADYTTEITASSLYGGTPFVKDSIPIDVGEVETEDEYDETKFNSIDISIPFYEFKKAIKNYDNLYNIPNNEPELKKAINLLYTIGMPYAQLSKYHDGNIPYYKTTVNEAIPRMQEDYAANNNQIMVFSFTDITLYATQYALVITPKSYKQIEATLVPIDLLDYIDKEKTHYIAFVVNINATGDDKTGNKSKLDKENISGTINMDLPITEVKTSTDTPIQVTQLLYLEAVNLLGEELGVRAVYEYRNSMTLLGGDTSSASNSTALALNSIYVGAATGVDGFFMIRHVLGKASIGGVPNAMYAETEDTFIYGECLFPYYTEIALNTTNRFYICNDDEERTVYGKFTVNELKGDSAEEDKPLDFLSEGNYFFGYDSVDSISKIEKSSSDIGLNEIN